MVSTMMSLSLCFSTKSPQVGVTQSAEREFEFIVEAEAVKGWKRRWSRNRKASTEVWFGRTADDIPPQPLAELSNEVFATYSGPDRGLSIVPELEPVPVPVIENGEEKDANSNSPSHHASTSSCRSTPSRTEPPPGDLTRNKPWNVKSRKAYGISMSLYEQHPINGKISGDPIADSFGICSRTNNSIMIVADGVNWGEKSKLAARCAIYGSMQYINHRLFTDNKSISNTTEAFQVLLKAIDRAHDTIIRYGGGQTTLCIALVLPIKDSRQFVVCIVNVGDSLAYVFSKYHGIREITTGSHDIQSERDIRDAGGAVGPVHGNDPELHNLTCSMTVVDPGDIVYLTTDGISDNFDPVVTKIAVASSRRHSDPQLQTLPEESSSDKNLNTESTNQQVECKMFDGKPEMAPHERHQYAVKEMERIIHEFELFTEQPCSAQELCGALLQHVLKLTDPKRKVLEDPNLYGKKLKSKDRKRRDSEIIAKLSRSPGKLDHATIIGYDVGVYQGNDDEDYEVEEISDEEMDDEQNPVSVFDDVVVPNVVKVSSPKSHDLDKKHDACRNRDDDHDTPILSPESQKKKNSLKNIKLKIKSRFKSPGRKSRSISDSTPSPCQSYSTDSPAPVPDSQTPEGSTVSTQSGSSLTNKNQGRRTLELKNALLKEQARQERSRKDQHSRGTNTQSERGRSPHKQEHKQPIPCHRLDRNSAYVSPPLTPPDENTDKHSTPTSPPAQSQPQGRVRGRREMWKLPAQSPTATSPTAKPAHSPTHEAETVTTSSESNRRMRKSKLKSNSSSENEINTPSPHKELWVIKPKLADAEATPSEKPVAPRRRARRDLQTTTDKVEEPESRSQKNGQEIPQRVRRHRDHGNVQHSKQAKRPTALPDVKPAQRPTDLPNVKRTYSRSASDSSANQKSDVDCEQARPQSMSYVLPRLLEICTEDEIFV